MYDSHHLPHRLRPARWAEGADLAWRDAARGLGPPAAVRRLRRVQPAGLYRRLAFGRHKGPFRALVSGLTLHAAVRVGAHDRKRLEQLCRYITRPALSDQRVKLDAAGQVELKLKTPLD